MFVPGKPLQPSVMFVGEGSSLPKSGATEWHFTGVGYGLTHQH